MAPWLLLFGACHTPMLLSGHHPRALAELPETAMPPQLPTIEGSYAVTLVRDDTLSPIGGHLDDHHKNINPVQQSYVLAQPGHVVAEGFAEALRGAGATVYRSYGPVVPAPEGVVVIALEVDHLEVHTWTTKDEGTLQLARGLVFASVDGAPPRRVDASVRIGSQGDVIEALAAALVVEVL